MSKRGNLPYLPGLDGLRAVAVIGVLLFHAGYGWASGGFLGVSAFFTLSGFLITTLLLREHEASGGIDVRAFWIRRARRLLPAMLLAAAGILLFAATVASNMQADSVAQDGPWAMLYLANWRFIVEGQSYTDLFSGSSTSPLLHLWSLAIEEQFYLVVPLVAVACGRTRNLRRMLGLATVVGLAASFAAMAYFTLTDADLSRIYYGTDTRAAELLIGVGGAVLVDSRRHLLTQRVSAGATVTGVVALMGMAALWVSVDETSPWLNRGGFAVHAVLTLVVILTVSPPGPLQRLLSRPMLLYIGRISYGLYLVHWPIYLWLTPDRVGVSDIRLTLLRVGLSVFVATASFVFLEKPIRDGRIAFGPLPVGLVAVVAALFATLPVSGASGDVVFEAINPPAAVIASQVAAPEPLATATPSQGTEGGVVDAAPVVSSPPEARERPARVMLLGDSVMLTLGRGFERMALSNDDVEVLNAAQIGCPVGEGGVQRIYGRLVDEFAHCRHVNWDPLIDGWDPDVIVLLSGVWDLKERKLDEWVGFRAPGDPVYDAWLLDEYRSALDRLSRTGAIVVLVRPACLSRTDQNGNPVEVDEFTPGRKDAYDRGIIDPLQDEVLVYDLDALVCGDTMIDWSAYGIDPRPDGVHFSEGGGLVIAEAWVDDLLELASLRQRSRR